MREEEAQQREGEGALAAVQCAASRGRSEVQSEALEETMEVADRESAAIEYWHDLARAQREAASPCAPADASCRACCV